MFLDEPTSGLDSAAATQVMEVIRELAVNNGIAVLATIHQPRSTIFAEFHNVCLLAKVRDYVPIWRLAEICDPKIEVLCEH